MPGFPDRLPPPRAHETSGTYLPGVAALVRTGTCGFAYRDWVGTFYPPDTEPEHYLARYAQRLGAVELGATFHRLPSADTARQWASLVGGDFRLCLTAPRQLTRDLRPARTGRYLPAVREVVEALGSRAGPLLVQIPSTLEVDLGALDLLLEMLRGIRVAVEFRHASWHNDACLRLLSHHGAALAVNDDVVGMPLVEVTGEFTYWRLRRVSGEEEWDAWAERAAYLSARGIEVFAFLRPDRSGHAPLQAEHFARRVEAKLRRLSLVEGSISGAP